VHLKCPKSEIQQSECNSSAQLKSIRRHTYTRYIHTYVHVLNSVWPSSKKNVVYTYIHTCTRTNKHTSQSCYCASLGCVFLLFCLVFVIRAISFMLLLLLCLCRARWARTTTTTTTPSIGANRRQLVI